jgi:hypothetical protein
MRRRGLGDGEIAHTRLHSRGAGERIDGENALELRERQQDAVPIRHRAAGKPGPRTARDDRHSRRVAKLQDRHDLCLVLR